MNTIAGSEHARDSLLSTTTRWIVPAQLALVFVFGFSHCFYFGRFGFMPLDQSIIFEGGWRILSGEVPWRDFYAPYGVVPAMFQAPFFAVFGVTWRAYILHAAVFNGLFCVLSYILLRQLRTPGWAAVLFGSLSGVAFYTPTGVPHMDQHAFFFGLLAAVLLLHAARTPRPAVWRWALVLQGPLMLLAFLSKQVPAIFLPPALAVVAIWLFRDRLKEMVTWALAGGVVAAVGLTGLLLAFGVPLGDFWFYQVTLPGQRGGPRFFERGFGGIRPFGVWFRIHFLTLLLATVGALVLLVGRRRFDDQSRSVAVTACLLAVLLTAVSMASIWVTNNQWMNSVPYIFLTSGLLFTFVLEFGAAVEGRLDPGWVRKTGRYAVSAFLVGFVLLTLRDAERFNYRTGMMRGIHQFPVATWREMRDLPTLPGKLSPLRWTIPEPVAYNDEDLLALLASLAESGEAFLFLGTTSIVNGLLGNPSRFPSMTDYYVGIPNDEDGAWYEEFQRRLMNAVDDPAVTMVVIEESSVWVVRRFPDLKRRLTQGWVASERFGSIQVLRRRHADS